MHLGFVRRDEHSRRRVGKGDEFNKAASAPPVPPPAPAAPEPTAGENGDRPADEPEPPGR